MSDSKLLLADGTISEFSSFIKQRISQSKSYQLITYRASYQTLMELGLLSETRQGKIIIVSPSGMNYDEVERLIQKTKSNPKIQIRQWNSKSLDQVLHQKTLILEFQNKSFESYIGSANYTTHGAPFNCNEKNKYNNELTTQVIHSKNYLLENFMSTWKQSQVVDPLDFNAKCPNEIEEVSPQIQLVEFQKMMVRQINRIYARKPSKGVHGCVLNMPTGTGKTITSISFLLRHVILDSSTHVLWIAPSRELVDQAYSQLEKMSNHSKLPYKEFLESIEFKTIQKVQNILTSKTSDSDGFRESLGKYKAIVIDEAHFGSDLNNQMLPNILSEFQGFRLGLSATPFRMDVMGSIMFKKFFSDKRVELSEMELKNNPDLSIINGKSIFPQILASKPQKIQGLSLEPTQFELNDLKGKNAKFKDDSHIKNSVLNQISAFYSKRKHGVTIVFCKDTIHANALYDNFLKTHSELRTEVVHTKSIPKLDRIYTDEERKQIYIDTREGKVDVLFVVDLYTTGIDFPNVESIFVLRPTNSPLLYTQMIGRGMRGPAFGGTEKLTIVDFIQDGETHSQSSSRLINFANHNQEIKDVADTTERINQMVKNKHPFKVCVNTVSELVKSENPNRGIFKILTPSGQNIRINWKHSGAKSLSDWLCYYQTKSITFYKKGNTGSEKGVLKPNWKVIYFLIQDEKYKTQLQKITNEVSTLADYQQFEKIQDMNTA